jgi:hypothetical protein
MQGERHCQKPTANLVYQNASMEEDMDIDDDNNEPYHACEVSHDGLQSDQLIHGVHQSDGTADNSGARVPLTSDDQNASDQNRRNHDPQEYMYITPPSAQNKATFYFCQFLTLPQLEISYNTIWRNIRLYGIDLVAILPNIFNNDEKSIITEYIRDWFSGLSPDTVLLVVALHCSHLHSSSYDQRHERGEAE